MIFSQNIIEQAFFCKLGFTPCKTEQPLRDMELQENEARAQNRLQHTGICLERTYC